MANTHFIEFEGEQVSNDLRRRVAIAEAKCQRTYTPSLAVFDRSAGSYHWTPEGRKIADFASGVLVANLGHNPTRWWQRLLQCMGHTTLATDSPFLSMKSLTAYNAVTNLEVVASERLLANMQSQPGGDWMQQVLWAASGSEAIQKSLWVSLARNSDRNMILATRHGFHGKKGLASSVTGTEDDADRDPRVRFLSFPKDECCDVEARSRPLDLAPYEAELSRLESELGDRICCLITEPYLGGGGSYHPQPEYLQLLERFCRERDILFILDEIQSNFGRTGPMYAYTRYGLTPDIVCLGKGMGNGIPVSALVGRADIFGSLDYGEASDTWSANPLASAAVIATLDEFESNDVIRRGQLLSEVIQQGLCRLKETGLVANVRGEGCVWGVECKDVGDHSAIEVANECVKACYLGDEQGRAIHLLGPLAGTVLRVSPPLVMPIEEADSYLDAMYQIFRGLGQQIGA